MVGCLPEQAALADLREAVHLDCRPPLASAGEKVMGALGRSLWLECERADACLRTPCECIAVPPSQEDEYVHARRREYRQRPEVRAREREYRQRPEVKARIRQRRAALAPDHRLPGGQHCEKPDQPAAC